MKRVISIDFNIVHLYAQPSDKSIYHMHKLFFLMLCHYSKVSLRACKSTLLLLLSPSWFMLYSDIAIKHESLFFKTKPPAGLKNGLAAYLTSCDPVELYPISPRRHTLNTHALHLHTHTHTFLCAFRDWKQLLVTIWRYIKAERVIYFLDKSQSPLSGCYLYCTLGHVWMDFQKQKFTVMAVWDFNEQGKMYYPKENL